MKILNAKISIQELKLMAESGFGNFVKAVVDIEQRKIAIDGELHSDEELLLLDAGSKQENLWGINIYPELDHTNDDFIEFDSMINLRPSQNNRSRSVEDEEIQKKIKTIVHEWLI
jgi:hypothetical protein